MHEAFRDYDLRRNGRVRARIECEVEELGRGKVWFKDSNKRKVKLFLSNELCQASSNLFDPSKSQFITVQFWHFCQLK